MIYYFLITALIVSIDSFICGFSLSFSTNKKSHIILGIALTVLVMCLITNYLPTIFIDKITDKTASLGGIILVIVGINNLIKSQKPHVETNTKPLKQSLLTGFAVGFDGASANLSLSLMGINAFYVPLTIAIMHAILIWLGIVLASKTPLEKFAKIGFIPPLILIILGGYKLLGFFI